MSEEVHAAADEVDGLTTRELVELMNAEDRSAVAAVRAQLPVIAGAVDQVAERLRSGGRLHYFGAGTSGRLAELDAAECPATFGIDRLAVQAHNAGDGPAEDDSEEGQAEAVRANLGTGDVVIGISARGRTRYVLAAVGHARTRGALTISLTCAPGSRLGSISDIAIEVETGPEVIAGSTRLKAGTVQKVVLNMISTGVFTRLGHTYRGRMVGVVASNEKLGHRAARVVQQLTGVSAEQAASSLAEAGGNVRIAILMLERDLSAEEAARRLEAAGGDLHAVLDEVRS